jgi:hypothetical protein
MLLMKVVGITPRALTRFDLHHKLNLPLGVLIRSL